MLQLGTSGLRFPRPMHNNDFVVIFFFFLILFDHNTHYQFVRKCSKSLNLFVTA